MNRGVQALVAVACLVVIAAAGVWGWQQYDAGQKASAAKQYDTMRAVCLDILGKYNDQDASQKTALTGCVNNGFIGLADVTAARAP